MTKDVQRVKLQSEIKQEVLRMGNKLRASREKKGMTQEMLAKKSGVSRATISALENGKATCVKTDTLTKLADAIGAKVSYLFF